MIKRKFGNTGFEITPVVYGGVNFSFVVENIEKCLEHPLTESDVTLLKESYEKVRDYPFFPAD